MQYVDSSHASVDEWNYITTFRQANNQENLEDKSNKSSIQKWIKPRLEIKTNIQNHD